MEINQSKFNKVVSEAKQKGAGNSRWLRAIDRASTGILSGELIVTTLQHGALVTSLKRKRFQSLLPQLNDGSRWTVEEERRGWRVRQVWGVGKTTRSIRRLWIRWPVWNLMKERYAPPEIAAILRERLAPVLAAV